MSEDVMGTGCEVSLSNVRTNGKEIAESFQLNVGNALEKAKHLILEQAQLDERGEDVTMEELELRQSKTDSFLNGINNSLHISHLATIAEADHLKFKRQKEMEAMNPLMDAYVVASSVVNRKINYVARQMSKTMENLENLEREGVYMDRLGTADNILNTSMASGPVKKRGRKKRKDGDDIEDSDFEPDAGRGDLDYAEDARFDSRVAEEYVTLSGEVKQFEPGMKPSELLLHVEGLQYVFDRSVANANHIGEGLKKIIELERFSGARPYGNSRVGIPAITQPSPSGRLMGRRDGGGRVVFDGNGVRRGIGNVGAGGTVPREMTVEELENLVEMQRNESEID